MRPIVRDLYKRLLRVGADYPAGLDVVRRRAKVRPKATLMSCITTCFFREECIRTTKQSQQRTVPSYSRLARLQSSADHVVTLYTTVFLIPSPLPASLFFRRLSL